MLLAGAVPDVGVLGDHAERDALTACTDENRRMRPLDRLRFAYRAAENVAASVEVERIGLGPHPFDDRAGLIERGESLGGSHHVDAIRVVFAVHHRQRLRIGDAAPAGADAELEAATRNVVDSCCHLCQKRGMHGGGCWSR